MNASRRRWIASALGTTAAAALAGDAAGQPAPKAGERPIGDEGVGPAEDLMREHGVLRRLLLVYEEGIRRIDAGEPLPPGAIDGAAGIVRRFVEDYHERLEEEHLFPLFERARRLGDLVAELRVQHEAGRRLTLAVLDFGRSGAAPLKDARKALAEKLRLFVRMYRPHAAREDTVLFPALRELVSRSQYEQLGELFESRETKVLGERGFERVVLEVAELERALGIAELASFTPKG